MNSFFFLFSKILAIFLYPLPLFFIFSFLYLFVLKGFRQKIGFFLLIFFLGIFSTSFLANSLIRSLERPYPPVTIESLPKSDVVIVLGGMIQTISSIKERPELTDSADRLLDAVRIYKAGKAKKILFTGGSGLLFADKYREADLANKILLDLGVPKEDILLERESKNTYENATESAKILNSRGFKDIILVTSAFHFRRASGCFNKQRIVFYSYPTDYRSFSTDSNAFDLWVPSPGYLELSTLAIKEWVGVLVYELKGYL
ncbi:YdcF family protein [Leptospira ilyithenensis]|uniref:YdcF family protein n=1 Tax=Leptospira ilyithenensis TaxID=2484901 RepID=A0A4R9LLH5_9LEPT|nr:YdcF family protein [Leptospira ilyithenensis]